MKRIYLDHAATTPVRCEVIEAMLPYFIQQGYNSSSLHAEGRGARAALDGARASVAACLGAKPREIVFTGSGSEADNLAILGVARARRSEGRHVITTAVEHRAVLRAFDVLFEEGFEVTVLPVDGEGRVDPTAFSSAITAKTTFASFMMANNEIGTLNPLEELGVIARERGVILHTDAVAAAGQIPLDVRTLGVDLLSLSAHKFYGPKGVAALYVRGGTPIRSLLVGGNQEMGLRAGTENIAGIVGLARALDLAVAEQSDVSAYIARLRSRFEGKLKETMPAVWINGQGAARLPNNSSVSFPGVDGNAMLIALDLEGIAVGAGSACAAGALESSHVIAALGGPSEALAGVIRFSLGRMTTEDEIDRVLNRLPKIMEFAGGAF